MFIADERANRTGEVRRFSSNRQNPHFLRTALPRKEDPNQFSSRKTAPNRTEPNGTEPNRSGNQIWRGMRYAVFSLGITLYAVHQISNYAVRGTPNPKLRGTRGTAWGPGTPRRQSESNRTEPELNRTGNEPNRTGNEPNRTEHV